MIFINITLINIHKPMQKTKHKHNGFTMVEVALVVIIMSLIIATFSYGNGLIEQSRLRSLINNMSNYSIAIKNFQQSYQALPGDYSAATANLGCGGLCNGNGNGLIEWQNSTDTIESLRAWQHLYLARMITIPFPGVTTVSGQSMIGINIPNSGWPNAGIELFPLATTTSGATGSALQIAGFTAGNYAQAAIMTPTEAWALDNKLDDGIGGDGVIRAFDQGTSSTCVGTDNLSYNLSLNSISCYIRYLLFP
jgi:prepilin-type N-terminal cleavage/methylation domain-containing protein